ncbi:hypothetical protein GHK92_15695 [Nocardioides sp. dk4132]|uniref:O-methyltransferase n=1 Tax=unclassified Nocardioides TaxID=2615069 RepID=UPI001294CCB2|nr:MULTISPECIES: O-methyltransferase [unclassified Nocardioides]MQW77317.1 hypothetical protein [Nocardioides sp. dk4132]QGA08070.1 hypothetical protein GFH29_12165 [Nocardioides sp. dk884]
MTVRSYDFRPAKAAQRRMVVDACRRLPAIERLDQYQYVGFGGLEFIDFIEFHIALGVQPMTSIERNKPKESRFRFNMPYESIRLLMGESRDRLPDVDWDSRRAIVWLDYTDQLTTNILRDVDYVVRTARPGSMLLVTINGGISSVLADRLPNLREKLGDLVDQELTPKDMKRSGAAREQKRILSQHASTACREAHGRPFLQLFDIQYADGSLMHTWGGLIVDDEMTRQVEHCHFEHLEFIRFDGEDPLEIEVPFLTEREMEYLLRSLAGGEAEEATELPDLDPEPGGVDEDPEAPADVKPQPPTVSGVSKQDIENFRSIYRYRAGAR